MLWASLSCAPSFNLSQKDGMPFIPANREFLEQYTKADLERIASKSEDGKTIYVDINTNNKSSLVYLDIPTPTGGYKKTYTQISAVQAFYEGNAAPLSLFKFGDISHHEDSLKNESSSGIIMFKVDNGFVRLEKLCTPYFQPR